ncbi:carboxy terminal-processing peptidase [Flavobacteriaceae bacterium S0825]|uniref:carboxy terminal-processing peptidase n=1 Tax=Gaetbulibacter sp. S0825 TaxID=2720084 RepID=UPI00142FDE70|nr:carboxy terminal-processing peptidase [Gaetbulibacter sp. S0825]MCK0107689.1 carboxy terminal-processing peptidase [Flavobacteriaceae bacterium S0825]NIX63325.1 carboxy terminal-processing peptidase [Gaetbulibacter sp. S0825]
MKRNYNILLLTLLLAFASCSFTTKTIDDDTDKDKALMELITMVLEQGHFQPKDINDNFSEAIFDEYINQIDPFKRYFYESDIKEFEKFKTQLDDQIMAYDVSFFNLTHERLLKRMAESQELYQEVLKNPFDFNEDKVFKADYEDLSYVSSKKEMKERWRHQLKFSTIANYHDLVLEQEAGIKRKKEISDLSEEEIKTLTDVELEKFFNEDSDKKFVVKSDTELEQEARETTLRLLDELYVFIGERERNDYFTVYINTIAREFDPHTYYLAPEEREDFDVRMTGKYEGIGARLIQKGDYITITELISGGSAWRQNKLEVGDAILKVRQEDEEEGVNVVGMRSGDAVKYIKGPKGTNVILTLKKVDGTIEDLSIPRDVIELEETYAKSSTVKKNNKTFGVINLPGFYDNFNDKNARNSASDIKKEVERLKAEGMQGLVIDLRNNGGGSLRAVIDMVGLFIKEGPVVQVRTTGEPAEVLSDRDRSIAWDGPLVILVNENSASASEIMAAALQDYKRAIVIGSKHTFGKGSVQRVVDLNRFVRNNTNGDMGAIKLTIQKYYRINGGSVQLKGVESDVVVPDRYSYIDIGEKDQDNPLPWDKIQAATYDTWGNYFDYDDTIKRSKERMAQSEQLKLIDENAKWIKKIRDNDYYPLNYQDYKAQLDTNENEAKRFNKLADYKTNLTFNSLPYELALMAQDSTLKMKRDRWHQSLSSDVYIEEALNVLNDLKMSYEVKTKLATTIKN